MKPVERVEVVIDAAHAEEVLELFRRHELSGWSFIREVGGFGERGARDCDDITSLSNNHLLITTCDPDRLSALAEDLRPLLVRYGGVCLVSRASWLLH